MSKSEPTWSVHQVVIDDENVTLADIIAELVANGGESPTPTQSQCSTCHPSDRVKRINLDDNHVHSGVKSTRSGSPLMRKPQVSPDIQCSRSQGVQPTKYIPQLVTAVNELNHTLLELTAVLRTRL